MSSSEVITALHFNQHQVDYARIFRAVFMPGPNKGGLVSIQQQPALVVNHARHAADYYPVLAAMMVHL